MRTRIQMIRVRLEFANAMRSSRVSLRETSGWMRSRALGRFSNRVRSLGFAAEGAGFEPARPEVCQFSRLVDSAALPPLHSG